MCWGVGGGKERCVGSREMWGGVWESVWGEWGSVLACGERNGGGVGKCIRVWGPNTLPPTLPNISLTSFPLPFLHLPFAPHIPTHFPIPPLIPLPTSPLPPPTPQHISLPSPHLPSPSQSVANLPCGEVTGNLHNYIKPVLALNLNCKLRIKFSIIWVGGGGGLRPAAKIFMSGP